MQKIQIDSNLLVKANEQIERVKKWYGEHESAFQYLDLKLHDVSFYCYDKMEKDFPLCYENKENSDYFNWFCEYSYKEFKEWIDNENLDFVRYQLGRTSSFWLHKQDIVQFERSKISWYWTINNAISEFYDDTYNCWIECNADGLIDEENTLSYDNEIYICSEEDVKESVENQLQYIIDKLYNDFTNHFDDMIQIYEYIQNFKEHQVDNFKEWILYYEETLQAEKDEEEEYQNHRVEIVSKVADKEISDILVNSGINNDNLEKVIAWGNR